MKISIGFSQISSYLERINDTFLERLIDYLRMPSISAHGIGMGEVAEYLLKWLGDMGFNARLMATPGWPMVYGKRIDQPGKTTVLLYGHYDVQPVDPLDAWITPPFEPTIRNGRIYARGVGDNKGQHFANLLAIESILNCFELLPCNVIVLLEGEEEIGSPHMPEFVSNNRDSLLADLVLISDGPVDDSGRSRLEFGVRGVVSFELRARGANRDLHSGNWGGVVPNPLWTLVHLLSTMKNTNGEITIDGFYDHVLPATDQEKLAFEQLFVDTSMIKNELGIKNFDAPLNRLYHDRLAFWPTLTINGLHGGYDGPGSKTVLPCEAVAKCDVRLVEAQSVEEIYEKIQSHVKKNAPEVELIWMGGMDPSKTPLDSPYATPIIQGIIDAQGEQPLLVPMVGGSLPNYAFTKILGLPTFMVPYANADEANHAPNENLEIERFYLGIKTGAAILLQLGKLGEM